MVDAFGVAKFWHRRQSSRRAGFRLADFAFADDESWTGLRYYSDSDDSDFAPRSPDEPSYVVRVACENRSFLPKGCGHHNGVDDIRRFGHPQQSPGFVSLGFAKRNDHATSQEAPELGLLL